MSSFFATVFPDLGAAEEAQRLIQRFADDGVIKLVSSVVILKGEDGEVSQHHDSTPGAAGAVMTSLIAGIIGLAGGPAVAAMGAAGGAISGGWFDMLRAQDRNAFMEEVVRKMNANSAALLGEVVDPAVDAKRQVEASLTELGGVIVGKES